ncbi:acyl-CoA dehydrogenase [Novosphingobium sp. PC22D]|uniref:acyl-CoA dehydrogenase family protein n=1 Tax=Novosphingobium sp. PC22D TaxID=1962403 RepID=UPI000BF11B06|nr:acyl-CoA dehydrogenase family protein [Novosphingobium sp. PC22D]PEQ11487.1 acyl-CoA dehydrogenase [Novosphingobium sp. PC22D]
MLHVLESDQEMLRDTTARFLDDKVPLSRLRKDRDDPAGFAPEYWTNGAELGWTSLLVSEEDDGGSVSGRGAVDLSLIAYEFGRHAAPGPLVDCNVVAAALAGRSGDAQSTVLAGLLDGSLIAACCLGTAPWQCRGEQTITIARDGDDLVIDGAVRPVEAGAQAAWLLVSGHGGTGPTQALVPVDASGLTIMPLRTLDVTRRYAAVTFDKVRVPARHLVGDFGGAADAIARQVDNAAVILAAESVGAMDAAFAMTLDYAFDRYTFGRALASYQALKHRFADLKSWLEASHAIADAAAEAVADSSPLASETASAARAYIGQYGTELVQDCVQLHGGIGVTYEHDLHFFLRRVALDAVLHGTVTDHRRLLAAARIGQEKAA